MKRTALVLSFAILLSATGCTGTEPEETTAATRATTITTTTEETADEEEVTSDVITVELGDAEAPETTLFTFEGISRGRDLEEVVEINDVLNISVLDSQLVGRIGSPVEVIYDDHVEEPKITFTYDPDELRGVPEENIIMVHGVDPGYVIMDDAVLDTDNNTISVDIEEGGVYILTDSYEWIGTGTPHDVAGSEFVSDWERERDTGSIMELADREWAEENFPYYTVSTVEELASVVYWVNACPDDNPYFYINIVEDIDLTGYEWEPMGWSSVNCTYPFRGTINGNGHTITGMHIEVDYIQAGFIGWGTDSVVTDINFTQAYVSSSRSAGIVGGEVYTSNVWTNVYVEGEIVTDAPSGYGAIIGRDSATTFQDCGCDVKINGEDFPYFTYTEMYQATTPVEEVFTLTLDGTRINRDVNDDYDITWHIECDGVTVLERNANNETTLDPSWYVDPGSGSTYTVYLIAHDGTCYVRVSNIIEFQG